MTDLQRWVRHGDEMRRPLLVNHEIANSNKIVIVGGGLSGMCCAFRIAQQRPDLSIIIHEHGNRLGGVISTWQDGEWICDLAVNATRPHPAFWRLIDDLGLSEDFTSSRRNAKSRWILIDGKKHRLSWSTLFKIGPIKLYRAIKKSRSGGFSVAEALPNKAIADALCLGIVNDVSANVDADFLLPSLTRFGPNPPIKKSKLTKMINASYPIFTPKKGSIASLRGGMQSLIDSLSEKLSALNNVEVNLSQDIKSRESIAEQYGVNHNSILWAAPGFQEDYDETSLSIFAIGYQSSKVANVEVGYGTLIPDRSIPISGILHESDIHQSKRCPEGHRLFRLMVPHNRWDGKEQSVLSCAEGLLADEPDLFVKIGERKIPKYQPGYMAKIAKWQGDESYVGWSVSGVSITHVVDEAERVAELF